MIVTTAGWVALAYCAVGMVVLFRPVVRGMGLMEGVDCMSGSEAWAFFVISLFLAVAVTAIAAMTWLPWLVFRACVLRPGVDPAAVGRRIAGESPTEKARCLEARIDELEQEVGIR